MNNCIESGFNEPCNIEVTFPNYLRNILNEYNGNPIKIVYINLLKYNVVEKFITYVETVLYDISNNNEEKHKWLLKFLHITSVEQICRTIILCELIIDMLKLYNAPIINIDSTNPYCLGCCNI